MNEKYILVNDVGTTGTRAVIFDHETNIISEVYREIPQIFPEPGWTEQNPADLFESCMEVTRKALDETGLQPGDIAAMGIATQRATSMIWDAETGEPVYNAITWQDTRMSDACEKINHSPLFKMLHLLGGAYQRIAPLSEGLRKNLVGKMLITAAHFTVTPAQSSAHARWVLDNVPGAEEKAAAGRLLLGTVDTWIVWNYTRGVVHATDYSNVSATGMYDPFGMRWSPLLLKPFRLPGDLVFPEIRETSGDFGVTEAFGDPIPIKCVVADQQAALFGEACFERGSVKCTNGTGTFIDMNTGDEPMASIHRMTPMIAWRIGGETTYIMEGIISSAGSSIQWLRDNLQIIKEAAETEELAQACRDCGGVYVVPAFTGLTAPYWDPFARGTVIGLTRATTKEQVVRATLESIAYQCKDVIEAMQKDTGIEVRSIKADGGASANNFLLQFLADILDVEVERPQILEATALGAAFLAGIAAGMWRYPDDIERIRRIDRVFSSGMGAGMRDSLFAGWKKAVGRASQWA
ncbi:MAG: glycerol kinase [Actinobacteria bacterium]|jgi:glycerol kinase|nr:MAG: glycerol kinase [Actinomycetota bacterium]